jgi:hypothetical protein
MARQQLQPMLWQQLGRMHRDANRRSAQCMSDKRWLLCCLSTDLF